MRDSGVPAEQMLIVSFSNASVDVLRTRIAKHRSGDKAPLDLSQVKIMTAHAFACTLIETKSVLSEKEASLLLGSAIRAVLKDCKKGVIWSEVSSEVKQRRATQLDQLLEKGNISLILSFLAVVRASKLKVTDAVAMARFAYLSPYVAVLRALRPRFASIKRKKGVVDYGDMLVQAARSVAGGAPVPFTHILVDEYQDCSAAQIHLLAQLANLDGRSIMVFGDPSQAIFGFGGSRYTPLSEVIDGVRCMSLPKSRRLSAQNAQLATAIDQHGLDRAIETDHDGEMPKLFLHENLAEQTQQITQHIAQLIEGGAAPHKIIVLARIKALLAPVEQCLLAKSIPTRRMGVRYDRKHALRVLKLIHVVERAQKRDKKITPEMLQKALPVLTDVDSTRWKKASLALKKVSGVPSLEGRYRLCAKAYLRLQGGIRKDCELRADVNRWEPSCRAHSGARAMRDSIRAMDRRRVFTGTIHAAKGGEWDHVLIVGATDGLLPLYLACDDEQSLAEERNLLYVAVTRASETVWLYHAPAHHARTGKHFEGRSRFLDVASVRKTLEIE